MTEETDLMQLKKTDLVELVSGLTAKVNSIQEALEKKEKEVKRTKVLAKINSLLSTFEDKESYSEDFLSGVAHGLSIAPKTNSAPVPKENGGQLPPVGESDADSLVFTPNGYIKKSEAQGLAVRLDVPKAESVM